MLGVVLALVVGTDPEADRYRSKLLGDPVPAFDLPLLGGGRVSDETIAGGAVIVNFWNTWCIPCLEEHPALVEFYRRHADGPDFVMIGIVRDDTRAAVRRYVRERPVGWMIAFDPEVQAALGFGTRGQPETFAISPDGVIVGANIGASTVADLERMLGAARGER